MNRMTRFLMILLFPLAVQADWELVADKSSFTFETTKNHDISEEHAFHDLSGMVFSSGMATVTIDLRSVDTGIPIRDERMRNLLFDRVSKVTYEARIDPAILNRVVDSHEVETTLNGTLTLNGIRVEYPIEVEIERESDGRIKVESESDGELNVGAFGFSEGIEKLREIAGLKSISPVVSFEFRLEFAPVEKLQL